MHTLHFMLFEGKANLGFLEVPLALCGQAKEKPEQSEPFQPELTLEPWIRV